MHVLQGACVAKCINCKVNLWQSACVAKCTCCKVQETSGNIFKPLFQKSLKSLKLKWKRSIKLKEFKKSLKFRNLSNAVNRLYKPWIWIKSSVSSMTSAEEGQPPSNEPEEWQDTHPLSPLRWGTTQVQVLQIASVGDVKCCKLLRY